MPWGRLGQVSGEGVLKSPDHADLMKKEDVGYGDSLLDSAGGSVCPGQFIARWSGLVNCHHDRRELPLAAAGGGEGQLGERSCWCRRPAGDRFEEVLADTLLLYAPSWTLRGGTRATHRALDRQERYTTSTPIGE
jgi:hypothetical protein